MCPKIIPGDIDNVIQTIFSQKFQVLQNVLEFRSIDRPGQLCSVTYRHQPIKPIHVDKAVGCNLQFNHASTRCSKFCKLFRTSDQLVYQVNYVLHHTDVNPSSPHMSIEPLCITCNSIPLQNFLNKFWLVIN